MIDEIAPSPESWAEHLRDLDDRQLTALAKDYRWLDEEARAGQAEEEFRKRREAIIGECERRGLNEAAAGCKKTG